MSHHVVLTWVVLTRGTAGILDINPLTAAKKQELSCSFPKTTACKIKVMIAVTSTLRQDKCSQDTVGYHSDFHQSIRYIYILCILCYITLVFCPNTDCGTPMCMHICVCMFLQSPSIHSHFHTSILSLNKWVQSTVTLPLRHSIYLFICLHSFLLLLAGDGEGNYWCGTAGGEANLSVGTSEV